MKSPIQREPIENPLLRSLHLGVATAFGLGYMPKAPGTAGSLLGIPLGLLLIRIPGWQALIVLVVLSLMVLPSVGKACRHWGVMDDGRVVIDEVVGQAFSMLSLRYFVLVLGMDPPWEFVLGSFLLFRLLDITKPFPARTFDRKANSFGVMADDIVVGLYASLIIWAFIRLRGVL